MLKFIKAIFISLLIIAFGVIITLDAENMINAVKKSIDICLQTIIPSLFGFMAISSLLMKSGLYKIIFKPFYFVLRFFIHLNEDEFSIFILSLAGGYPVGAKLIADMLVKEPDSSVKRIFPYCYCGSPVFIIAIVGISLFGNTEIGFIVYVSNAAANVIAVIIFSIFTKTKSESEIKDKKENGGGRLFAFNQKLFTDSVMSAASSLFPVCTMIVVFGIIIEAVEFCYTACFGGQLTPYIFGFLEISRLTLIPECKAEMLPIISALTSFGGCCIIMQAVAILGGRADLRKFLLLRIPIALFSGLLCFVIFNNLKIPLETAVIKPVIMPTETGNSVASLALLVMSALLLTSSYKKKSTVVNVKLND